MRDAPDQAELLEIARLSLQGEVMPKLSGGARHAALMIANALGIVSRQLRADRAQALEQRSLEQLFAYAPEPMSTNRLTTLNRELADSIRAVRYERIDEYIAYQHLLATAIELVSESNPKYLQERHPTKI